MPCVKSGEPFVFELGVDIIELRVTGEEACRLGAEVASVVVRKVFPINAKGGLPFMKDRRVENGGFNLIQKNFWKAGVRFVKIVDSEACVNTG